MAQNISEIFAGEEDLADSFADYFIEHIHIRLIGCGIRTASEKRINNFMLPTFLAVAYKSGSAEIQRGAGKTVLRPGSFYIFRPYDVYSGKMVGDAPVCFAFLQFDIAPFMERYRFGLSTLSSADSVFQSERYRRFGNFLAELAEDGAGRAGRTGMLRQLTKLLIAQIVYDEGKHGAAPESPQKGRESLVINRAYQYAADHLSEPIRIEEILKYESISKATLEKTFHKILSTTPQRALLRFKIERSMEMLQYNAPINSIVKALGFSSMYHYSNAFMAVAGMRPTEYRRRMANGHIPTDGTTAER
jgi:AraC-like DNA-binding protein